jgi:uncharacterized protein
MRIEFDPNKSQKNARERELPFEEVSNFDWETALYSEDTRHTYPEQCFTRIVGGVRIISFRKANIREVRHYKKEATD